MSGKDIDDMTFEKIKFWTVSSLVSNYLIKIDSMIQLPLLFLSSFFYSFYQLNLLRGAFELTLLLLNIFRKGQILSHDKLYFGHFW